MTDLDKPFPDNTHFFNYQSRVRTCSSALVEHRKAYSHLLKFINGNISEDEL